MPRRARELPPPTASERAFEALLASYRGEAVAATAAAPAAGPLAFLDDLYAHAEAYARPDAYATIGDATSFNTKVAGITFGGRQDVAAGLKAGYALELVREPQNEHDASAVAVRYGSLGVGYLKREIARRIAPNIDRGERYTAVVTTVTGGGERSTGINIFVSRERSAPVAAPAAPRGEASRDDVRRALIGERPLREAQRAVLERVEAGRNTLAVLGTGRGKSLCFQLPAAVRALEDGAKTIVLYPLRALANDQHDALLRRLAPLGLRIHRANGAIDAGERAALMDALESGAWDLILATPEFVTYHRDRFRSHPPAMVVVDEAHHLHDSRHRAAYGGLGATIAGLGARQVLALTATAADDAFARIRETLGIEAWVIDPTIRANLRVVDGRGTTQKVPYIERHVAGGDKAIVYGNSRNEVSRVAEALRRTLGDVVAFYHAGVPAEQRRLVEDGFRAGLLRVVVATSAFGEGIDLPDVRHVFLYHLNFDVTEFNQQAGRAGRDGEPASIHLLYGQKDRALNEYILERSAPTVETLRRLYTGMKRMTSDGVLRTNPEDIAATLDVERVDRSTVRAALRIFADVGLVVFDDEDGAPVARFTAVDGKVDLTASERFAEGEAEREAFERFRELALGAAPEVLQTLLDRPIYPSNVPLLR